MPRRSALASTATAVFAVLCATSAALQYNDPDPVRWAAMYLAAGAAAVAALVQPRWWWLPTLVALGAVAWAVALWTGVAGSVETSDLWRKMSEKGGKVEEMREAGGLSIVVVGCALAAWRARRARA
ncbi:MAG: hypothetical protein IPL61_23640 [Myxococcales bacterium]|nr:hypothetical protein [Myxococcales bacterium]